MGEPEHVLEHTRFAVGPEGEYLWDGGPLPATFIRGMAVFVNNDGAVPVDLTVLDSADSSAWAIVPFSTFQASGLLALGMASKSQHVLTFQTGRRYLRFVTTPAPDHGLVMVQCVQYPPRGPLAIEGYGS